MIQLKRPLVFFDLETTGVNVAKDRIVEISYIILAINSNIKRIERLLINPQVNIPKEASDIHGISTKDVKDAPIFRQVAHKLFADFSNCDVAGYNSNNFDVPLLAEEFNRAEYDWPDSDTRFIDVCNIFKMHEKRDLSAAVQFYLNRNLDNAHSAEADTQAAHDILMAQIKKYSLGNTVEELEAISKFDNRVDLAGKLIKNDKGEVCFNFGKHTGVPVILQPGYGEWMLKQDFSTNTKKHLEKILDKVNS